MYLTKYFFADKEVNYLFPRMTQADLKFLDGNKSTDKEWFLLRNEPNVRIRTVDEIVGLDPKLLEVFMSVRLEPLKGVALRTYQKAIVTLQNLFSNGDIFLTKNVV
jgi:hypothetical protein